MNGNVGPIALGVTAVLFAAACQRDSRYADAAFIDKVIPPSASAHVGKSESRDCEGPDCRLHVVVQSASQAPDVVRDEIASALTRQGWIRQPTAFAGQVAMCHGETFVSLATAHDELRAFPGESAAWPQLGSTSVALLVDGHRRVHGC